MDTGDKVANHDDVALKLAIDRMLADPDLDQVKQIKTMLKVNPWREVAEFASYHCQHAALRTRPWEAAPRDIGDVDATLATTRRGADDRQYEAALLLRKCWR